MSYDICFMLYVNLESLHFLNNNKDKKKNNSLFIKNLTLSLSLSKEIDR